MRDGEGPSAITVEAGTRSYPAVDGLEGASAVIGEGGLAGAAAVGGSAGNGEGVLMACLPGCHGVACRGGEGVEVAFAGKVGAAGGKGVDVVEVDGFRADVGVISVSDGRRVRHGHVAGRGCSKEKYWDARAEFHSWIGSKLGSSKWKRV